MSVKPKRAILDKRASSKRASKAPSAAQAAPRKPQQERGQQRVDAILDATIKLIEEQGISSLTVHGIAKRAHTSIGSMYHFFPDLEAVVAGLSERHREGIRTFEEKVRPKSGGWAGMSSAEVANVIVDPFVEYLSANPYVELLRAEPKLGAQFLAREEDQEPEGFRIMEEIFEARNARVSPELRRVRAAIFIGAVGGTMALLTRSHVDRRRAISEMKKALAAYLDTMEKGR